MYMYSVGPSIDRHYSRINLGRQSRYQHADMVVARTQPGRVGNIPARVKWAQCQDFMPYKLADITRPTMRMNGLNLRTEDT